MPCSGFGVVESKPDIYLHREEKDIGEIVKIQKNILYNAAKYVVQGGKIVYSTCTVLQDENKDVINDFLDNNDSFVLLSDKQYLPDGKGIDGFYIALLEKIK